MHGTCTPSLSHHAVLGSLTSSCKWLQDSVGPPQERSKAVIAAPTRGGVVVVRPVVRGAHRLRPAGQQRLLLRRRRGGVLLRGVLLVRVLLLRPAWGRSARCPWGRCSAAAAGAGAAVRSLAATVRPLCAIVLQHATCNEAGA